MGVLVAVVVGRDAKVGATIAVRVFIGVLVTGTGVEVASRLIADCVNVDTFEGVQDTKRMRINTTMEIRVFISSQE